MRPPTSVKLFVRWKGAQPTDLLPIWCLDNRVHHNLRYSILELLEVVDAYALTRDEAALSTATA